MLAYEMLYVKVKTTNKMEGIFINHQEEAKMLVLINNARQLEGCSTLKLAPNISISARKHSLAQLQSNKLYHKSEITGKVDSRLNSDNIPFLVCAENCAEGKPLEYLHKGLMGSPGHRKNILSPDFTHIGIGIIENNEGRLFVTQVFVLPKPKLQYKSSNFEKEKIIREVNTLRSSSRLPQLRTFTLDSLESYARKLENFDQAQLGRINANEILDHVEKELRSKRINYSRIFLMYEADVRIEISNHKNQFMASGLSSLSVAISKNDSVGCLCSIFLFLHN